MCTSDLAKRTRAPRKQQQF